MSINVKMGKIISIITRFLMCILFGSSIAFSQVKTIEIKDSFADGEDQSEDYLAYIYLPRPPESTIFFDGEKLLGFDNPGKWKIENGTITMLSPVKTGRLMSFDQYDDVQIHVEWKPPFPPLPKNSGNSGVYFGPYELQILDSYKRKAKSPDSQAGSIYGQYPPYVNTCFPPEQWTSFDVLFNNAQFDMNNKLLKPARMTVIQNGIFIHHDRVLLGEIARKQENGETIVYNKYIPHQKVSISFQEHGSVVSFRNIWLLKKECSKEDRSISEFDLRRMLINQKDPSYRPYSKTNIEPPVIIPVGNNRPQPSDAKLITLDKIGGNFKFQQGQISATGLLTLSGNYKDTQIHLLWEGAKSLNIRILDEEVVLAGSPGVINTADIALSLVTFSEQTSMCITALVNGIFSQSRKFVESKEIKEVRLGNDESEFVISNLWFRDIEPHDK